MKKVVLFIVFITIVFGAMAAPFKFLPHKVTQPDGTVIECYLSGDEFFNWIHDKDGYSIIKGKDGYYYYAFKEKEKIVASNYRVNSINPEKAGLKKWVTISKEEYTKRREVFNIPAKNGIVNAPHTGNFNNIVIYIRFSGESELLTTRNAYDDKLNPETGNTLKSYFKEVSYDQLTINSTHYPDCASPATTNASYEDSHTRDYFQPYDATTNPNGYNGDSERTEREHQLLVDAVTWVNTNYPVDASLDIDGDDDGYVDNVCFMIRGNSDGWAELLWAHRWSLYSKTVNINGKRVYDYTFQPENQVSVRTLCHEMFHALGAPDLYHYYNGTNLAPVSSWDLMESGSGHMGAYMKYEYANQNWISTIPEITTNGTYSLNPLTSSTNNCYKIASPNSTTEYFIVEYRKRGGTFESSLPGDGLLVYRINSNFNGNAQYDGTSVFDEVYIYRPGGTTSANGSTGSAHFSSDVSRTEINNDTDPGSFLSDGSNGDLNISNITSAGSTISFDVTFRSINNPSSFEASASALDQIDLSWILNNENNNVILAYNTENTFGNPEDGTSYNSGDMLSGGGEILYAGNNTSYAHQSLTSGETYYYKIWSVNSETEYSNGVTDHASTPCVESLLPINEDFSDAATPSCWQNIDNVGAGQSWVFDNPNGYTFGSTTGDNGFALLDSDEYGSGNNQNAELISPLLDLSIYTSVNLSFEHYYEDYQSELAELAYSLDAGQTWTVIDSWSADEGTLSTPAVYNNDISALVAGESSVQIRWRYEGSYGYYWLIDDVSITGVSSGEPVALTKNASNIEMYSATLNGTVNANTNSITQIQFEYGLSSGAYTQTLDATPGSASGSTNTSVSVDLTGLSQSTTYFYRVKCMNDATAVYGEEKSFTTSSPTPVVTTNDADGINVNGATLHATINAMDNSITNIEFEYGTQSGTYSSSINATPSTATGTSDVQVQAEITSLNSNTEYFYRITCFNGATEYTGDEKSFTTEERPSVAISCAENDVTNTNPITILFSFSEEIASFTGDDITITNAMVSSLGHVENNDYNVQIIPNQDGEITLKLLENAIEDLAGYGNIASDIFSIDYDATLPEVTISSSESGSTSENPIPVTFTFTEDVSDFTSTDIIVTNGSKSNFSSTNDKVYTLDITPADAGEVIVQIMADAVYDVAENANLASDEWTINYSFPTGIADLKNEGINIFPNPTKGLLYIDFTKSFKSGEIKVFDYSGRIIYNQKIHQSMREKVDLTNQPKGLYIITIILDNKPTSTQLIIQ
ncbi:MAG: M6 family metalloprotease domain-containing protein [Bacteroidetes bacterium]|nr:M6 family metalloprotease domain-containing protein [Bacteroidota bacterium]